MNNKNMYWNEEEFEDLVSRSLVSLYENKINKICRKVPKFIKPTDKDIENIRQLGVYFPPNDREILYTDQIDLINDGLPKEAIWSYNPLENFYAPQKTDLLNGEYFRLGYIRKIQNIPPGILNKNGFKYFANQHIYKMLHFSATENNGFHLMKSYVTIDQTGKIHDTYARTNDGKLFITAHGCMHDSNVITEIGWTAAIIGFYQDKKYLWNVTANEGYAKATFGVYPEEIKSLFYARSLPLTAMGRKRPILHWVAAHRRRLKSGIEIDIDKHLRGINDFVFNGTKFSITQPTKLNT